MTRLLPYGALALAVLLAVPVAMALLGEGSVSLPRAMFFHLLSTIAGVVGFHGLAKKGEAGRERENLWWIFALAICGLMPAYGIVTAIVVYALQHLRPRRPPPVVEDEITVPDVEVFSTSQAGIRQFEILERLDIEPFVDIFRSGQTALKKSAVQFLGAIPSPAAVKTLNRALMDEDIEVRLYAAGVIGLIDDCHAREIDARKAHFAARPNDLAAGLAFADASIAYAETGLLDGITRAYYYRQAIGVLEALPETPGVDERLARSAFALEELDTALDRIDRCLAAEPANAGANRLRCAILFARREYAELLRAVTQIAERRLVPADDELLRFWT